VADISELIADLDALLEPARFRDLGPNGLQVPGARDVRRVLTAVSAQRAVSEAAVERQAQLVLVHHGLFWDFLPTGLTPVLAERLRPLMRADVNLAAYHLPLDAHPEVGNNAILADRLGCAGLEPFGRYRDVAIGRRGTFAGDGLPIGELLDRVRAVTAREPLLLGAGPERVRTIGIVSGAGADALPEAVASGLDAFVTGEPREHVTADAREAGIHFIAAGHAATETFGVRALGDRLAERFGVEHVFADVPNPV
jgi:dinuclear metal center YbgI/SA1388 family protein